LVQNLKGLVGPYLIDLLKIVELEDKSGLIEEIMEIIG